MSPASRAAVEAAIKKTRYRVNPHARNLATSRSNSVDFLLTESQQLLFEDPNFSMLVRGTAQALAAKDISLVLVIAGSPAEQARATDFITAGHVDGVLLAFSSALWKHADRESADRRDSDGRLRPAARLRGTPRLRFGG